MATLPTSAVSNLKINFRPEQSLGDPRWAKTYHKRSNVETVFSMIKSKFGGRLRSKQPAAQVNEVLA